MQTLRVTVPRKLNDYRLDIALVNMDIGLSRRKIREIIDVGGVYVNGKRVRISSRKVEAGAAITMEYNLEAIKKIKRQSFELNDAHIIFECDDYLIMDKPPGLASQATKDQSIEHVIPCLERYFKAKERPAKKLVLVHRLDKETSGLLIVAKNDQTATYFTELFKNTQIKKEYRALSLGKVSEKKFEERCYLSSIQPRTGLVKKVNSGGKSSHTSFEVLSNNVEENISLIACHPTTGRSHQIRVHLALHRLPILGDKKYSIPGIQAKNKDAMSLASEHHFLHAFKLRFKDPVSAEEREFSAPYPENFAKVVALAAL